MTTDRPARAIVIAAARPFGPAPTTTASGALELIPGDMSGGTSRPIVAMASPKGCRHAVRGKVRGGSRRNRLDAVPVKKPAEADASAARQGHLSRRLHRLP